MNGSNLHAAWIGETRVSNGGAEDKIVDTTLLVTEDQVIEFLAYRDARFNDDELTYWKRAYEIKYAKGPDVELVTPPAFLRYAPDSGGTVVKGEVEGGDDQ